MATAVLCLLSAAGGFAQNRTCAAKPWDHCTGAFTFSNGDRYVGEFRNDKPGGLGSYTFSNRDQYVGEFADGAMSGKGVYTFANGDKYTGSFRNGNKVGYGRGVLTYTDGSQYAGEFLDGRQNGIGTYTYTNGRQLAGRFADDRYVGPATTAPEEVHLEKKAGVLTVPVTVNGRERLNFVIDSGASDVIIPRDVADALLRTGTLTTSDITGKRTYALADGSKSEGITFRFRSLQVGSIVAENVPASISPANGGALLLGQSFLERFTWSIDNGRQVLILH